MSTRENIHPPKWPLRLLRFFIRDKYLEEIEGDMEETFYNNLNEFSLARANRKYTLEVIKLLRPKLLRTFGGIPILTSHSIFGNYFKISLRNLARSPLNSFINIFGLAAALGICIFAFAFAQWTYSTDQFHVHKNEVYLVTFTADRDGIPQEFGLTPRPLGEMMQQDFGQIIKVCRVEDMNVVVKVGDSVFPESIRFTDPEFLQMLTFPLKWGNIKSLADPKNIILSENMAIKYFGQGNPIGKDILIKFDKENGKVFKVSGVAYEFPKSRTISFNFLVNFENLKTAYPGYDLNNWNSLINATLIEVDNHANLQTIEKGMAKYKKLQNEKVSEEWAIKSFALEPLATLHKQSEYIRDDISRSSRNNYISINYLVAVGGFLLILACINYINIAIATAAKRLKEIGVRKSVGATKSIVTFQFLIENMLITFFALVVGFFLGYFFFIPGFEQLWKFNMDFHVMDIKLWAFIIGILLITSILSGLYPALYISKFQIVGILKGNVKFGQKNLLTKIFLGFQLGFACIFITIALMFSQNNTFMAKRSWGYNYAETMYTPVPDYASFEELSAEMSNDPDVLSFAGSVHHLGINNATTILHFPVRDYEVDLMKVGPNYFETMGLQITDGRFFDEKLQSDLQSIVVNELFVKNLGWNDPIGQTFEIDSISYHVVGVVKDFHSYSFAQRLRPLIFTMANKKDYHYLSIRYRKGTKDKTNRVLHSTWAKLFPEIPFEGGYQEDVWANYFVSIRIFDIVWKVISLIAVSLAGLGLYGLITLNVAGRSREFCIRKVLGAGIKNLTLNILERYMIMFVVALGIGAPAGFLLSSLLFESSFPYHMPITIIPSVFAVILLAGILLLTVFIQMNKIQQSDPVQALKTD